MSSELNNMSISELEKQMVQLKAQLRAQGRGKGLYALMISETPYKWQVEALNRWYNASGTVEQVRSRGIIVAPTAAGKTLVAFLAMRDLGVPTIVIVPTEPIMWRWFYDLSNRGADVGLFYGGMKRQGQDVDIAIYNSVERTPSILDQYEFVIFDEIHHLGGQEFSKIMKYCRYSRKAVGIDSKNELVFKTSPKKVMGLTATLARLDGMHQIIEKGATYKEVMEERDRYSKSWAIPVVFQYSVKQAIEDNVIANIIIETRGVHLTQPEQWQYDEFTADIGKLWATLQPRDMTELLKMGAAGMKCVSLIQKRKALLSGAVRKPAEVCRIVQGSGGESRVRESGGEKILVFSESIVSIESAKEYMESQGVKCGLYHSGLKDWEKKEMFNRWVRGEFQVLMSVRALDEGVDVPEAKIAIVIASGSAKRQWIQRSGRVLRKTGATARLYIVYCAGTVEDKFPSQVRKYLRGE